MKLVARGAGGAGGVVDALQQSLGLWNGPSLQTAGAAGDVEIWFCFPTVLCNPSCLLFSCGATQLPLLLW